MTLIARALKAGVIVDGKYEKTKKIRISTKAKGKFRQKVRELMSRNNPLSMSRIIQELNEYIRGWIEYFRVQEFRYPIEQLDSFIRNRLRAMQLKKWKKPKKFQGAMIRQGSKPEQARRTWINMRKWRSALRKEVLFTLGLQWFRKQGLIFLSDFAQMNLEFKFSR